MTAITICLGAGIALLIVGFLVRKARVTHPESAEEQRRRTMWGRIVEWLAILF